MQSSKDELPYSPGTDQDADAAERRLAQRSHQLGQGSARAAVLGVNDGLVTNLCLVLGLAGASASPAAVQLAGFASLVAGAFSMAAGEWISVLTQVELTRGVLAAMRDLLSHSPSSVERRLREEFVRNGYRPDSAARAARDVLGHQDGRLRVASRALLGINPDEPGSPKIAAAFSLVLFALGAAVPLLPWFLWRGEAAVWGSVVATALAATVVGGVLSRSSQRGVVRGAVRQLVVLTAAAGVTFALGRLVGTSLA
ncbi:VIT1/CCC1 transporter family protein [Streptomyces sp. V1I1]|uniref:VIT1/CCC1 transporter family protein n=1 Tax=Streptomyces sp. V1I1 TaxID=3042272 RepID=UPI002780ABA8|nr:VIT1/CCC1 transporter family protein [Streptomyces sp. V1I1]MDQ0938331.1 VIT1/CCC1 family predicted Fe2+/Mn2+ transporter [Streptomyces sp. V1I1]